MNCRKVMILYCLLAGCFATLLLGCTLPPEELSSSGRIFTGEHKLRKMLPSQEVTTEKASASFFLILGSYNSEKRTDVIVRFAWQTNSGEFAISSLLLEKIRIKLSPVPVEPTIRFRWHRLKYDLPLQEMMDNHIYYAVVTVNEADWPVQVHLPLNQ